MSTYITTYIAKIYDVLKYLNDQELLHKALTRTASSSRKDSNILYRLEYDYTRNNVWLYVQSDREGGRILSENGDELFRMVGNPVCLDGKFSSLKNGSLVSFQLRCSPHKHPRKAEKDTGTDKNGDLRRPKKYIKTHEDRKKWLDRKGLTGGFSIVSYKELQKVGVDFYHNNFDTAHRRGHKDGYDISGIMLIEDAEQFRRTMCEGIGSGKAYGFGMLLVKKA